MRVRLRPSMGSVLVVALSASLGLGCSDGGGLTSLQLAQRTTDLGTALARQVVDTAQFLEELESLSALWRGMEMVSPVEEDASAPRPVPPPPEEGESDPAEEAAQALADLLNEHLFAPGNLESEEPGRAVYLLRGQRVCEGEEGEDLPRCIADVDSLEIRVQVDEAGDGVRLALLVGPARSQVCALELQADRAELATDLAEAKAALVHVLDVLGENPAQLPELMQGRLALTLRKNAERDFSLRTAVRQAVQVRYQEPELGLFELQAAAADPASLLRVEGLARRLSAAFDAGAVQVVWPAAAMFDEGAGSMRAVLSGLSGAMSLGAEDDRIVMTGLGLGADGLRLELDGSPLAALSLGAAGFDLTLAALDGLPLIGLAEGLSAELFVALERLDAFLGEDGPAPDELTSQTYTLTVSPAAAITLVDGEELGPDALRVVGGSLRLSSSAVAAELFLEAGQCASWDEAACSEALHFLLECAQVHACP